MQLFDTLESAREQVRAGAASEVGSVESAIPNDGSLNSSNQSDGLLISSEVMDQMISEIVESLSQNLSSEIVDEASEVAIEESNDRREAFEAKVTLIDRAYSSINRTVYMLNLPSYVQNCINYVISVLMNMKLFDLLFQMLSKGNQPPEACSINFLRLLLKMFVMNLSITIHHEIPVIGENTFDVDIFNMFPIQTSKIQPKPL